MLDTMIKYTENNPNIILSWDNVGIVMAKLAQNQSSELVLQEYQNKSYKSIKIRSDVNYSEIWWACMKCILLLQKISGLNLNKW